MCWTGRTERRLVFGDRAEAIRTAIAFEWIILRELKHNVTYVDMSYSLFSVCLIGNGPFNGETFCFAIGLSKG